MYSIDKSMTDIIAVINNRIAATTPPSMAPPDVGGEDMVGTDKATEDQLGIDEAVCLTGKGFKTFSKQK